MYAEFDNVMEIDGNRQVLFDYSTYMNTLEIDHVLKTHSSTRNVFKGAYARNRLLGRLSVHSALKRNTEPGDRPGTHWVALYIDANSHRKTTLFKGLRELYEQTLYELDLLHH